MTPRRILLLCLCLGLCAPSCRAYSSVPLAPEDSYSAAPEPISLADYRARLIRLHSLVDACSRSMTAAACDWKLVGPDSAVQTPAGTRKVEFAWLRSALSRASTSKQDTGPLRDAALRLSEDLAGQQEPGKGARRVDSERAALKNILSTGGYAQEVPPTLFERLRDAFLQWLGSRLNGVIASQGPQLIVNLLLISLIIVACGGMAWWFARKVQSQRLMLTADRAPHPSAPSAQDWQKWLDQGRRLAGKQQWREAIHHVYWSAISRLESRGLWPADRARTPREYLGLLGGRPELRDDLFSLTRSFERTWYGDQAASQPEFEDACALLERLAR